MTYRVAYDAASAGFQGWPFVVVGLLLTAVSAAAAFAPAFRAQTIPNGIHGPARGCFAWVSFVLVLAWTIAATTSSISIHERMKAAAINNTCETVEGRVAEFRPGSPGGDIHESFTIGGVRFSYSPTSITGGFNRSQSHGGPIREGLPVRICYVRGVGTENAIVRLEIATTP
ncbi:MAG: hypothetical protein K2X34_13645 [Hyphomonadaceae bacterium]|nr:hypothetical protein [Hyphomonadaceae bacterium]